MKMAKDPEQHERDEREDEMDEEVEELVVDPDRPTCPQCGWHNTRLSHTKTIIDSMLKAFSVRAFRCRSCGNRFRAVRREKKA